MADTTIEWDDFVDGLTEESSPANSDFIPTKKTGISGKKTKSSKLSQVATNTANLVLIDPTSSAKSANYTILDDDGIGTIRMTTGSSTDKTVTLPTAADNTDREITILKVDSGTNNCIVDGEGAETINGTLIWTIFDQYTGITVKCDGTEWKVIKIIGRIKSNITDSASRVVSGVAANTWYQPAGANLELTVEPGLYRISYHVINSIGISTAGIIQPKLQLGYSTTPGANLVGNLTYSATAEYRGGTSTYFDSSLSREDYITVSSTSTFRLNLYTFQLSGTPSFTLSWRGDQAPSEIIFERIG
jgi:hypothetical protein